MALMRTIRCVQKDLAPKIASLQVCQSNRCKYISIYCWLGWATQLVVAINISSGGSFRATNAQTLWVSHQSKFWTCNIKYLAAVLLCSSLFLFHLGQSCHQGHCSVAMGVYHFISCVSFRGLSIPWIWPVMEVSFWPLSLLFWLPHSMNL